MIALATAIPVILFPAAFVRYLNVGGIYHVTEERRQERRITGIDKKGGK